MHQQADIKPSRGNEIIARFKGLDRTSTRCCRTADECDLHSRFSVFTKMTDLTYLPMLYIWTNASVLSYMYLKLLSYAKDLIPNILATLKKFRIAQILNEYGYNFLKKMLTFYWQHNIYMKVNIYNIGRNVRSVTSWKLRKTLLSVSCHLTVCGIRASHLRNIIRQLNLKLILDS